MRRRLLVEQQDKAKGERRQVGRAIKLQALADALEALARVVDNPVVKNKLSVAVRVVMPSQ